MGVMAAGSVVLVPFPFSDLSGAKRRPSVVLAQSGPDEWILCQVTSNPYGDRRSIAIMDASFSAGSLRVESFARPGKLFTADSRLIAGQAGVLTDEALKSILEAVIRILKGT